MDKLAGNNSRISHPSIILSLWVYVFADLKFGFMFYLLALCFDSEVWGFGWNKMIPNRFLLIRSIITIYFYRRTVNSDLAQVSFFRKVWHLLHRTKLSNIWFVNWLVYVRSSYVDPFMWLVHVFRWVQLMRPLTEGYWKAGLLVEWHFRSTSG